MPVAGLDITSYLDDPDLKLGPNDKRPRSPHERWVHLVVVHTTKGIPGGKDDRPQVIRPGFGPTADRAQRLIRFWTGEDRGAGAHLVVDFDGQIACTCDLALDAAYHAGAANGVSIGIEVVQGGDAELYEEQLNVTVRLIDALTALFRIQRQIPHAYVGPSQRLMASVADVVGVVGHRDLTSNRGRGDPGNAVFNRLGTAGYEPLDLDRGIEREEWRRRQRDLGVSPPDGIAGPGTVAALAKADYVKGIAGTRPLGLWVARPGDDAFLGL